MKRSPKRAVRRVDAVNNNDDHWCLILAMRGRSNRAIFAKTGLSDGQISYRLKIYDIHRMDYRDGRGEYARKVDKATEGITEAALVAHLRLNIGRKTE